MSIIKLPNPRYINEGYLLKTYQGLSSDSDYIPVYALFTCTKFETSKNKVLCYDMYVPFPEVYTGTYSTIAKFLFGTYPYEYGGLAKKDLPQKYIMFNGNIIVKALNLPLMTLCAKKGHIHKIDKENPSVSDFCLVIDKKLVEDPIHNKVYKNIKKLYIDVMDKAGLDIIYVSDLIKSCYNADTSEAIPTFRTVKEMRQFAKEINQIIFT